MSTKKGRKATPTNSLTWAILLAGGRSSGFGEDVDPVFLSLNSKPVLTYSLSAIERCPDVENTVIVAPKERVESVRVMATMFGASKVKAVVAGSGSREAMVRAGLEAVSEAGPGYVAIVDGAVPGVTPEMISETVRAAHKCGAATVARPITDPIAESEKGSKITGLPNGSTWWITVGPQAFRVDVLERALQNAAKKKLRIADEAAAVAALKEDVQLVPIRRHLVRIDAPADLMLAEFLLRQ